MKPTKSPRHVASGIGKLGNTKDSRKTPRKTRHPKSSELSSAMASASATQTLAPGLHLTSHFLRGSSRKLHIAATAASPLRNPKAFRTSVSPQAMDSLLSMLGFGRGATAAASSSAPPHPIAQGPDDDVPAAGGNALACFGAGCFWGVELAFQRVPGVTKTEVGYTQGNTHMPTYEDVCGGRTGHSEVVRVHYSTAECSYSDLLNVFWDRHDPTTLNRQGGDVGTQYRSGIYYYSAEQEKAAKELLEAHQKTLNRKIVTEILPAKKFYRAESYHQQYLAKGGRFGFKQSTEKGCNDPIRCYG